MDGPNDEPFTAREQALQSLLDAALAEHKRVVVALEERIAYIENGRDNACAQREAQAARRRLEEILE